MRMGTEDWGAGIDEMVFNPIMHKFGTNLLFSISTFRPPVPSLPLNSRLRARLGHSDGLKNYTHPKQRDADFAACSRDPLGSAPAQ